MLSVDKQSVTFSSYIYSQSEAYSAMRAKGYSKPCRLARIVSNFVENESFYSHRYYFLLTSLVTHLLAMTIIFIHRMNADKQPS